MAQTNVNVLVQAIDKASAVFVNIGKNIDKMMKKTASGMATSTTAGKGLTSAFGSLGATAIALNQGLQLVQQGFQMARSAIEPLISASITLENSMLGLNTVARAFGQDADAANQAAKDLSEDGLMTFAEAAAGLKNLLATGFNLDQAISLMNAFKDSAAFNRQGTLEFGEAIVGATQGIKNQNSIMVDNAGITKNLSNILEEAGYSQNDLGLVTSDTNVRMALYNGLMREASIFQGDAARAAGTLGGQISQTKTAIFNFQAALGDTLQPAVSLLASSLGDALTRAMEWVQAHSDQLKASFLALAAVAQMMVNIVIGAARIIIGAWQSITSFSFEPLKNAFSNTYADMTTTAAKYQEKIEEVALGSSKKQEDAVANAANNMANAHSKKTAKMIRDLERETEAYEREMAKRQASFEESLADLIYSHLDKVDQLEEQMSEENDDFSDKMADRKKEFDKAMSEIEERHAEKVEKIKEQLADELEEQKDNEEERIKAFNKALKDAEDKFQAEAEAAKRASEGRISALKRNFEREVEMGAENEQELWYILQEKIANEKAAYSELEAKQKAHKDEYLAIERDKALEELEEGRAADAEKLSDLQQQLDEENEEYKEAIEERKTTYEEETAKAKEEHEKRIADYSASLAKEREILSAHQADVDAVKDKAREDDITRLKRHYEEERKEAERAHLQKMKDITEQGTSQGANAGASYMAGLSPKLDEIEDKMDESGKQAAENFSKGIREGFYQAGQAMFDRFVQGLKDKVKSALKFAFGLTPPGQLYNALKEFGIIGEIAAALEGAGSQTGATVPGPIGQPRLMKVHGGEEILPYGATQVTGGGGGEPVAIHLHVGLYAGTETEKRNIARELYRELVQVARSQNKTVSELMGA